VKTVSQFAHPASNESKNGPKAHFPLYFQPNPFIKWPCTQVYAPALHKSLMQYLYLWDTLGVMATVWFETCVEGYFGWKLPVGRQLKSLEEYSPLKVWFASTVMVVSVQFRGQYISMLL
jgi:hypothetical protein